MTTYIIVGVIVLATAGLGVWAYGQIIQRHMAIVAAATDKPAAMAAATSTWGKFLVLIEGWKTIVLGWISAIAAVFSAIPSDVVNGWTSLPWAGVFDQRVAAMVSIVCGLLIPIVHATGLSKTATTTPADPT